MQLPTLRAIDVGFLNGSLRSPDRARVHLVVRTQAISAAVFGAVDLTFSGGSHLVLSEHGVSGLGPGQVRLGRVPAEAEGAGSFGIHPELGVPAEAVFFHDRSLAIGVTTTNMINMGSVIAQDDDFRTLRQRLPKLSPVGQGSGGIGRRPPPLDVLEVRLGVGPLRGRTVAAAPVHTLSAFMDRDGQPVAVEQSSDVRTAQPRT